MPRLLFCSLAFALTASQANAQASNGFCTTLARIVAESPGGFKSIISGPADARGDRPVSIRFPGMKAAAGDACHIQALGNSYVCTAGLGADFAALNAKVKACLTGWKLDHMASQGTTLDTYISPKGHTEVGVSKDSEDVYLDIHENNDPQ
jgi:hypothetical protein